MALHPHWTLLTVFFGIIVITFLVWMLLPISASGGGGCLSCRTGATSNNAHIATLPPPGIQPSGSRIKVVPSGASAQQAEAHQNTATNPEPETETNQSASSRVARADSNHTTAETPDNGSLPQAATQRPGQHPLAVKSAHLRNQALSARMEQKLREVTALAGSMHQQVPSGAALQQTTDNTSRVLNQAQALPIGMQSKVMQQHAQRRAKAVVRMTQDALKNGSDESLLQWLAYIEDLVTQTKGTLVTQLESIIQDYQHSASQAEGSSARPHPKANRGSAPRVHVVMTKAQERRLKNATDKHKIMPKAYFDSEGMRKRKELIGRALTTLAKHFPEGGTQFNKLLGQYGARYVTQETRQVAERRKRDLQKQHIQETTNGFMPVESSSGVQLRGDMRKKWEAGKTSTDVFGEQQGLRARNTLHSIIQTSETISTGRTRG